ncbi:MAG: arylsulfatase, partial [Verrucomicrobiae bacterium]|nr:arylsulfatase [Verrucomicrobiae bacterium]
HDISPLINGTRNARSPYKAFYYYNQRELHAVRSGPWKLFLPLKDIARHPHYRKDQPVTPLLFNVEKDIACKTNVAAEHPDIVKRLTGLAEKARADLGDNDRPGKGQRPIGTVKDPKPQKLSAR